MKSRIARKIFKCCDEANDFFILLCDLMRGTIKKDNISPELKQLIERSKLNKVEIIPCYRHNSYQFTKAVHIIEKLSRRRGRRRLRKIGIIYKEIKDE